ncbi:hypothetical protein NC651_011449 [Populus alba x Populus x berolinensis]|nr:hypothetical protein NC651_011449 [Populus alba x Populus x berolinensis]
MKSDASFAHPRIGSLSPTPFLSPPQKLSSLSELHSNPTTRHIATNLPCITQPFANISNQSQLTQAVSSLQILSCKGIHLPYTTMCKLQVS